MTGATAGTGSGVIREIRGAVIGVSSAFTALGAHSAAHGAMPSADALVVVVLACAGLGALIATHCAPGRAAGSTRIVGSTLPRMVMLLLAGQAMAHIALVASAGGLMHSAHVSVLADSLSPTMLAAHGLATAVTVVMSRALESVVLGVLTAAVTAVALLARIMSAAPVEPRPSPTPICSAMTALRDRLVVGARGTRGPPARMSISLLIPG